VGVATQIRALVADINKSLPEGTQIDITQDGGVEAQNSLNNVVHALVFGAGLTIFVVYVFLNSWRSTLITALSLPTSVIASFIAVWLCGFTLNFMSLLGLSLAIGVLIDDAIVVRENIVRHMERGFDRRTAALNGTAEIGLAVAATTKRVASKTWLPIFVNLTAIILAAFFGIRQKVIGLRDFAKPIRRFRIVLVLVGVQFLCQLAIGDLNRLFVRPFGHA
jgi:multidrug efflux pump subunit AcrB